MILSVIEGTDYSHTFSLVDDATNEPLDITNSTITFAVFKRETPKIGTPDADNVVMEKSIGDGVTILAAGSGLLSLNFVPGDTQDKAGNYEWEMEIITEDDKTYLAGSGKFLILPRRLD